MNPKRVSFAALRERDTQVIERCVPAHMLVLMLDEAKKAGFEIRADVMHHLNMASAAPMAQLDPFSVSRLARRVDDVARALLEDLSPDDPRHGLYCCAMFVLLLVDEGRLFDVQNQAVLVAMLLMDDVKDDKKDVNGQLAVWRVEEIKWKTAAKKMLHRAMLAGFYA